MNQQEFDIFFALLRYALFGQPLESEKWQGEWSWKPIVKAIDAHVLQTLVAEAILSLPADKQPSAEIQSAYSQLLAMNMQEHIHLNGDICHIYNLLTDKGYKPVLMKGQGNATFFPKPLQRKCGDIDLYVGEKDCQPVCDYLMATLPKAHYEEEVNDKHYTIIFGKTEIEVHKFAEVQTPPQNNEAYQQLVKNYFAKPAYATIGGQQIAVPPHQFLPLYLFNHMWTHFKNGGIGYRQFADWAMALHTFHNELDQEQLEKDLKTTGLWDEWKVMGNIIVKLMGLPKEEFPFYEELEDKKLRRLARMVMDDGNFAKKWGLTNYKNRLDHFTHSLSVHVRRSYELSKVSKSLGLRLISGSIMRGINNAKNGLW